MAEQAADRKEARSISDRRRRPAATLLLITSVLWLHEWLPLLFVAAFAVWLVVHERLEGPLGVTLLRYWRRAWPPGGLYLFAILAASTLAYWVYVPSPARLLPVGLNALALALLVGVGRGRPHASATRSRAAWAARVGVVLGLVALLMSLEVALGAVAP